MKDRLLDELEHRAIDLDGVALPSEPYLLAELARHRSNRRWILFEQASNRDYAQLACTELEIGDQPRHQMAVVPQPKLHAGQLVGEPADDLRAVGAAGKRRPELTDGLLAQPPQVGSSAIEPNPRQKELA